MDDRNPMMVFAGKRIAFYQILQWAQNQCQRSAQFVGNIGIEPQTFVIQFLFLLMTFLFGFIQIF